jgi:hypothetical protein
MNNNSLQKKIKNMTRSFSFDGSNVYFDWGIIIGLFCIVALVLVSLSAGLFFSIYASENTTDQSTAVSTSQGSSNQVLDTADLTNLISIFQSKSAQMSVFTATYPGPSDPAVPMKFTSGSVNAAIPVKLTNVATSTKSSEASSTTKPKAK